jgi:DNA-binding protein Fis
VQRANVLAKGETILAKDLPQEVLNPRRAAASIATAAVASYAAAPAAAPLSDATVTAGASIAAAYETIYRQNRLNEGQDILSTIEVEMIRRAMEETRGNQLRSAMILGINRSTLKKRLIEMREAGIKVFS